MRTNETILTKQGREFYGHNPARKAQHSEERTNGTGCAFPSWIDSFFGSSNAWYFPGRSPACTHCHGILHMLAPLLWGFLLLLIFVLGIRILGPYVQKTQRQKQHWLNENGLHIQAPVTKHPGTNALVIGGRARGRHASYTVYLNWQDPDTGQFYSFRMNTRFSSALRNLPKGTLYPVQFDSSDLSFFVVPRR